MELLSQLMAPAPYLHICLTVLPQTQLDVITLALTQLPGMVV